LIPGARIVVKEAVEYTGVVTFKIADRSIALGLKAARAIWVKPVNPT
jgi:Fe2+ transport system protein FeoA